MLIHSRPEKAPVKVILEHEVHTRSEVRMSDSLKQNCVKDVLRLGACVRVSALIEYTFNE